MFDTFRFEMQSRALSVRVAYFFGRDKRLCPVQRDDIFEPTVESELEPDRRRTRYGRLQLSAKRCFDFVGALVGLTLLSLPMAVIAVAIRLESRGPILFRQTRTGLNNREFTILKFRSMYVERCDPSGVKQATADDPRVTPIGRVLRRTNMDELPQFFNVLKGDMSLIGPRPHVPGMLAAGMLYDELVEDYPQRHRMRPGITGLAQAHGLRGPTGTPELAVLRIVLDLDYVKNFSLWLDLKILIWTIVHELRRGNGF